MKNYSKFLISFYLVFSFLTNCALAQNNLSLWYNKPAQAWTEALPIGNGRLGAMVFGDPANEKIQLNESSFWSGGPSRNDNPDALEALPKVRQLIFDGKYKDAENLINQSIKARQLHGSKYQAVGYLELSFPEIKEYTEYYRELNLETAVFTSTFKANGIAYKREVFASQPDQLIVVKLTADKPGKLSFVTALNGPLQQNINIADKNTIEMTGLSSTHEGVQGQVKFNARVKIINSGGNLVSDSGKIRISDANEVLLLVSIATNFVDYKTLSANEQQRCKDFLLKAEGKNFDNLLKNHLLAYQSLFNRVKLDLGTSEHNNETTDQRIKNFSQTNDPAFVALYYQFGRYLLISSSQPGGQPANLQGIWNDQVDAAWDSKYTININTEMNYWPAEKCNLPEMHEPLIQMVKELSQTGRETAKTMYGANGWVAHHNTDIWRISGVVDGAYWGMWPIGSAWLSQHLWEKYLYSGDKKYLESVYPVLKSACEFYQDFLVEEPTHKWLVVCPSISPENNPSIRPTSVCAGATMDNEILFDLFSKTIKAAQILGKDNELMQNFQKTLNRMPPLQIGQYSQLQEWLEDLDNPEDKHRHVSHLYGLFPGNQISPYRNPELFEAAKNSLIYRGDVSTGWSMGWKVNLWARLLDGNHAGKLISDQLTLVDPVGSGHNGGTYPNFFDAHPPFQIDGNFGCTSGITEMLLQSHDGSIHLLPALPDAWKNGEISGLRAYGGFEVSFSWRNGAIQKMVIKSNLGGNCRIRVPNEIKISDKNHLKPASGENPNSFFAITEIKKPLISATAKLTKIVLPSTFLYDMETKAGETYSIDFKNE